MKPDLLLLAMLCQIALVFVLYILLALRKKAALKAGEVDRKQTRLDNKAWPIAVVKVSNNIANQFEAPVLFYIICFLLIQLNLVGSITIVLAWVFVLSRVLHAFVHVTSNRVSLRLSLFSVGIAVLVTMLSIAFFAVLGFS